MGSLLAALRGRRDTRSTEAEQQQSRPSRVTDQDKAVLVSRSKLGTLRVLIVAHF